MNRLCLTAIAVLTLSSPAFAQTPDTQASVPATPTFPDVTLGVVSFLQYSAELEESDEFNAFDVTRGYINIQARLSNRVRARLTPDVRRVTDATLAESLALRLEYAYLEVDATDATSVAFGMQETPVPNLICSVCWRAAAMNRSGAGMFSHSAVKCSPTQTSSKPS